MNIRYGSGCVTQSLHVCVILEYHIEVYAIDFRLLTPVKHFNW